MRKCSIFIVLFVLSTFALHAQSNVEFSQRIFNPMLFNPASTGAEMRTGLYAQARQQWVGLKGAPSTQTVAVDTYWEKYRSGLGFAMVNDKLGVTKTMNFRASYAYILETGEFSQLSLGLSLALQSRTIDVLSSNVDDPNDPLFQQGNRRDVSPNADVGLEFNNPFISLGASVKFLESLSPDNYNSTNSQHLYAYGSVRLMVGNNFRLEPLVYAMYREKSVQAEVGALVYFLNPTKRRYQPRTDLFWVGATYRKSQDFTALIGVQITKNLKAGYAFDYTFNGLQSKAKFGTHEFVLVWHFWDDLKGPAPCPAYRTYHDSHSSRSRR